MLYHFIHIRLFCNPMDRSPPGPSVHGIPQAGILEWVAISHSRGSSQPRDWTHFSWCRLYWQASSLPLALPRKPYYRYNYYFNSYILEKKISLPVVHYVGRDIIYLFFPCPFPLFCALFHVMGAWSLETTFPSHPHHLSSWLPVPAMGGLGKL